MKNARKLMVSENGVFVITANRDEVMSPKVQVTGMRPLKTICLVKASHTKSIVSKINRFNAGSFL